MRIGIDARLNAYRQGGIAHYTRELLAALAAAAPADEFVALQHVRNRKPLVAAPNVRRATFITPPHHRREQHMLALELWPRRLDLLHCPDFIPPLRRPCPAVITVHDLAFRHFPDILDADARRYYGQIGVAVASAEGLITVSESTRNDIMALLGVPAERINVVYEAVGPQFQPGAAAAQARRRINGHDLVAEEFLLFVSTIEPRKNIAMLLRALKLCVERNPHSPLRLVLAGARGWHDQPIFDLVRELRLDERVVFLGAVAMPDLLWLYDACRIYVNPSRYEGFGLPALEALACGAPSVVSAVSSLPEITADAALHLPVDDIDAWAGTLTVLWDDAAQRAELARRGPQRAAQFSWQRAAAETLAVYRRVAR
ncbi:MAG: glycosyltransferase family 4 protein [Oscillochloris sp.]|nr:glycosyltransferase family 4 protein [Oscillochloris sp.]